jgi:RNA polymerase sigma-70 factor (ECF subfamily)
MQPAADPALETRIHAGCASGNFKDAATLALEGYGPEVLRFLRARLRSATEADDAFLQFSEDLWVGLGSFRWQASVRVWLFVLARNAATRVGRARRREVPLSLAPEERVALRTLVRETTAMFARTTVKDRMRQLRLELDPDDQTLLILRIDRGLSWKDLALVLGEATEETPEDEVKRASARLRTRFQTAKKRLRARAEESGLLSRATGSPEDGRR